MPLAPVPQRKPRATFPPFITASSWDTVFKSTWDSVKAARGMGRAVNGTIYPKLTNGDAVTLVMALMEATAGKFPLWYQFAAVCYGWSTRTDKLDTSARQRDAMYPATMSVELWSAWMLIADDLDKSAPSAPRLSMDGLFTDAVFQGQVKAALREDGAKTTWGVRVPIPACKDPKTGKPTGKPHKGKDGKWTCDPVVLEPSDPTKLLTVVLIAGAIVWYLESNKPRRSSAQR